MSYKSLAFVDNSNLFYTFIILCIDKQEKNLIIHMYRTLFIDKPSVHIKKLRQGKINESRVLSIGT